MEPKRPCNGPSGILGQKPAPPNRVLDYIVSSPIILSLLYKYNSETLARVKTRRSPFRSKPPLPKPEPEEWPPRCTRHCLPPLHHHHPRPSRWSHASSRSRSFMTMYVSYRVSLPLSPVPSFHLKRVPPFPLPHSVLLACTRELPFRAQRCRGADLRARVHHHLPVLPPRRASPVRHSDTRVARRAERAGRGGQRHRLPRTRRNGTPEPAHGPALVDWRRRRHTTAVDVQVPRWKEDVMIMM